ncbi:hypothetical protein [Streptacidiphilus sp. PAMC 29251]
MTLPLPWTTSSPVGSQWKQSFGFPTTDISTYTWTLTLRTSTRQAGTPITRISSTSATASGYITVDTAARTVMAVLSATATASLAPGETYALALWADPSLSDATTWVRGLFTATPVAAP